MVKLVSEKERFRTLPSLEVLAGRWGFILLGGLILAVVVVLLVTVLRIAFSDPETSTGWTLSNFSDLYGDSFIYQALLNTAGFTVVSVFTSLMFAVPISILAERTTLPGRSWIFPMMTVSVLIPGFFTAMGWLFMFHPRIGTINRWLIDWIPFIDEAPFNILTVVGMGIVEGLSLSSLAFIMLAGTFRAMDPSLEESAQAHGLGTFDRLRTITLPLVWPGILATGLYVGVIGMAAFDIPAIIGLSNRIYTFSTFVYSQTSPALGPPNFAVVAASSTLMIIIALFMSWWYLSVIKRSYKYTVISGKNYRPRLIKLGRWGIVAGWGIIGLKMLLTVGLPVLMLGWASLGPYMRPITVDAFSSISLDNYRNIPWDGFYVALKNTLILMTVVPTMAVIFGLAISWVVVRSGMRTTSSIFDALAFLPHAVPNLIFAVAALAISLLWLPEWIPLYGSLSILIIVFVVTRISFPTRLYNNALVQIHKELDEAGYVFGLRSIQVVWYVLRPLLAPVILYSWLWMALLAYRELTIAAFLVTGDNMTLSVYVWTIFTFNGDIPGAAALSLLLLAMMLPLIAIFLFLGRKRFQLEEA